MMKTPFNKVRLTPHIQHKMSDPWY